MFNFESMNEILHILPYSEKTARIRLHNKVIATKALPGQFVIIKFSREGQRIPFSIVATDPDRCSFDIIIHRAAGLDSILKSLTEGDKIPDVLGPLGNPAVIEPNTHVLFFGDGAGVVPLMPIIKEANRRGCKVNAVLSEYSSRTQCVLNELEPFCETVTTVADEDLFETAMQIIGEEKIDKVFMSGPSLIMKKLAQETKSREIKADCLLNMLMIDGIGLCGICRVIVGGERKQTCTDGPLFDAHLVDYDQLFNRQRLFV